MGRHTSVLCLFMAATCLTVAAMAQERRSPSSADVRASASRDAASRSATAEPTNDSADAGSSRNRNSASAVESALRIEGEKRFRANCGRCHMAPHKFPPRVMATAIRHMRVRAMLTDEDMRYILHYMTQ